MAFFSKYKLLFMFSIQNYVLFLIPYLLLFPLNLSFSTDRCPKVFEPKDLALGQKSNLEESLQGQSRKQRVRFKPWFENLVKEFEGETEAKQHIIDTLVEYVKKYKVLRKKIEEQPKKLESWPAIPTIFRHLSDVRKEVMRQLRENRYVTLQKERKYTDLWYSHMLQKFNGDPGKADAYIIETILHYNITNKNCAFLYALYPKIFKDWPGYQNLPQHIRQEVINQRSRNYAIRRNFQDWFNELVNIHGSQDKALAYIEETILKYKLTFNNYRVVYNNENRGEFEKWPALPTIWKHFPELRKKINLRRRGKSNFTMVDSHTWYKEQLKLNEESKEATNIAIAKKIVRYNITRDNYKTIYNQNQEEFEGWPSLGTILRNFPKIAEMIDKLYEEKGKQKRMKPVVVQIWYEKMLNQNEKSEETTNTAIATKVVRFKISDDNFKTIYNQNQEEFEGWPSPRVILKNYPEIKKKVQELKSLQKQQEQSLQ